MNINIALILALVTLNMVLSLLFKTWRVLVTSLISGTTQLKELFLCYRYSIDYFTWAITDLILNLVLIKGIRYGIEYKEMYYFICLMLGCSYSVTSIFIDKYYVVLNIERKLYDREATVLLFRFSAVTSLLFITLTYVGLGGALKSYGLFLLIVSGISIILQTMSLHIRVPLVKRVETKIISYSLIIDIANSNYRALSQSIFIYSVIDVVNRSMCIVYFQFVGITEKLILHKVSKIASKVNICQLET